MEALETAGQVAHWDAERTRADLPPGRKIGQVPISWDTDVETATTRAHEQFRWFAGGWAVNERGDKIVGSGRRKKEA